VQINIGKWNSASELNPHHDHSSHPEKQNVMSVKQQKEVEHSQSTNMPRKKWRMTIILLKVLKAIESLFSITSILK